MTVDPVVRVEGVSKSFTRGGLLARPSRDAPVQAVRDVSLEIRPGRVLGVVGESGSGKSTLGRLICGLHKPDVGRIVMDGGTELTALRGRRLREARRVVQIVFQDSYRSLDPMMSVSRIVEEPMAIEGDLPKSDRAARVADLVEMVGLKADVLRRRPPELSGGQRQRVAIARSLATNPKLIVLDESVASLDRATQAHVLDLLAQLQSEFDMSYLFISHDLAAVRYISDEVIVMYLGEIVESGPAEQIVADPLHPYTKALRSAVPVANPRLQRTKERIVLSGDPPDPAHPPAGCGFSTRCPAVHEPCHTTNPDLLGVDSGQEVACLLYRGAPADDTDS